MPEYTNVNVAEIISDMIAASVAAIDCSDDSTVYWTRALVATTAEICARDINQQTALDIFIHHEW